MKLTLKTMTLSVALTASLMSATTGWAKSGNGDSYSGPTLAGNAVAMTLDKPITAIQLTDVIHACLGEREINDTRTHIFFRELYFPIYGNKFYHRLESLTDITDENKGKLRISNINFQHAEAVKGNEFHSTLTSGGSLIIQEKFLGGTIRVLEIKNFPVFQAETSPVENYHPISGDYIGKTILLKNLSVIYDYRNAPPFVKARNITKAGLGLGAPTELVAPVADFTNCVVEKLGKI